MAIAIVETASGPVSIAVVCDGVSGSDRADEASQAAADAALAVLLPATRAGEDAAGASARAVEAAQAAVASLSTGPAGDQRLESPSSTFVSAVVTSKSATVCWLGDSRAYWLGSGPEPAARQLTADDSVVAELVSAGGLSAAEAAASPEAHVITGWLGADLSGTSPHITEFVPPGPGAVLLCSDGLWNYLGDASELAQHAAAEADAGPIGTARRLAEFALVAGGADNITVAVALFPSAGDRPTAQLPLVTTEPTVRSPDE